MYFETVSSSTKYVVRTELNQIYHIISYHTFTVYQRTFNNHAHATVKHVCIPIGLLPRVVFPIYRYVIKRSVSTVVQYTVFNEHDVQY